MDNLNLRRTRDNVILLLNDSGLSIEAKRLILAEVLGIVQKQADEAVMAEMAKESEEKKDDRLEGRELSDRQGPPDDCGPE